MRVQPMDTSFSYLSKTDEKQSITFKSKINASKLAKELLLDPHIDTIAIAHGLPPQSKQNTEVEKVGEFALEEAKREAVRELAGEVWKKGKKLGEELWEEIKSGL